MKEKYELTVKGMYGEGLFGRCSLYNAKGFSRKNTPECLNLTHLIASRTAMAPTTRSFLVLHAKHRKTAADHRTAGTTAYV